mgnify:CR=1 FL=1
MATPLSVCPVCIHPHCGWNLNAGDRFCWGCGLAQKPQKPRKKPAAPKTKTTTPTRGPSAGA